MEQIEQKIITRNGWINGRTESVPYPEGITLGEFARINTPLELQPFMSVQINGCPLDDWRDYIPEGDEHILMYVLPQGGDNGKQALGFVAAIAVAWFAGPAVGFLETFMSSAVANTVYMMGSSLVLSQLQRALVKPPEQPENNSGSTGNPFYRFSVENNSYEPWGNVPRVYGRIRVYPKMVLKPLTLNTGDAENLRMAFDFGYGPLLLSDFKLGETPIERFDNVESYYHPNFKAGDRLQLFDSDFVPKNVGLTLNIDGTALFETTPVDTQKTTLDFWFPQGLYAVNKSNGGYVDHTRDIYISIFDTASGDWVPASNFGPVTIVSSSTTDNNTGSSSNTVENDFIFNSDYQKVAVDVWYADGVWKMGFQSGKTTLEVSAYQDLLGFFPPKVGDKYWIYDNEGLMPSGYVYTVISQTVVGTPSPSGQTEIRQTVEYSGQEVVFYTFPEQYMVPPPAERFKILIAKRHPAALPILGSPEYPTPLPPAVPEGFSYTVRVRRNTRDAFMVSAQLNFATPDQYQIRVHGYVNEALRNSNFAYLDSVQWSKITSYINQFGIYFYPEVPHTIYELQIPATEQLNGSIDDFSAVAWSLLPIHDGSNWIEPPTYDQATKSWSSTPQPTSNPAWIYADVLRGTANKRPIPDRLIDIDTLLEWAAYCDQVPPNDALAPAGYQCNLIIDGETTVKSVLRNVAGVGRASPARKDTKFTVIRDNVETIPVQLITPKNTSNFRADINYVKAPHAIKTSFLDEVNGYDNNEVIVYAEGYGKVADPANNIEAASVFETLTLPGTTRHNQAVRLTRYYMATALLQRERVYCGMDYESLILQRGDHCLVASDVLKAGGMPLRVTNIESNPGGYILTFDEPIPAGNAIRYRGSSDLISFVILDTNVIQIAAGTPAPRLGDLIEYGVSMTIKAPFIVEQITPGADYSADLQLVEFRPEIETAVNTGIIPPREVRPGTSGNYFVGPVADLVAQQYLYYASNTLYNRIDLLWLPPTEGKADYYNVYRIVDEIPRLIGPADFEKYQNALTVNVSGLRQSQQYTFGVEPIINRVGAGQMNTVTVTVKNDTAKPSDPEGFGCNAQTGTLLLYWSRTFDQDIHHYEIRYNSDPNNAEWKNSSLLSNELPANLTEFLAPLRPGVYFIKSVDAAFNYSENALATVVQITDLEQVDPYTTIDFQPFTSGAYDKTEVKPSSGELWLLPDEYSGTYTPPSGEGLHLVEPTKMRLYSGITLEELSRDEFLAEPWFIPLSNAVPLKPDISYGSNITNAEIEFRYSNDFAANYSQWTRLVVADITCTDVEFRLALKTVDLGYVPAVSVASVRIDWLHRHERGNDIAVGAAGKIIYFDYGFTDIPSVQITLENAQIGDHFRMSSLTKVSFVVEIFDASDNPIAGQIDWFAQGHGKTY